MAGFNIDNFLSKFQGGLKSYLFYFTPTFPFGGNSDNATYLVRTTTTPSFTHEEIIASWQGFDAKYAGRKQYETLSVTFNSDVKAEVLKDFYTWDKKIRDAQTGAATLPNEYFADQSLQLLDNNGDVLLTYTLVGAWPSNIAGASLDYSAGDTLQFDVTFTYQYHTVE